MAHQKDTPPDVYTLLKKGGEFSSRYRRSLVLEELTTVADYDILFTGLRLFTALLWCAARQPDDEAKLTAMRAAGQFADLFNDSEDLALPFRRISDALRHGAPVVTQRRRRGRPGLLDEDAILRGYAAATVNRLIAAGTSLPDALKSVAGELRGVDPAAARLRAEPFVVGWKQCRRTSATTAWRGGFTTTCSWASRVRSLPASRPTRRSARTRSLHWRGFGGSIFQRTENSFKAKHLRHAGNPVKWAFNRARNVPLVGRGETQRICICRVTPTRSKFRCPAGFRFQCRRWSN